MADAEYRLISQNDQHISISTQALENLKQYATFEHTQNAIGSHNVTEKLHKLSNRNGILHLGLVFQNPKRLTWKRAHARF